MGNKKILIVEDERPMATALELKLGKSGFFAHAVYDGTEAIKILEKEKYDLILLDLMMPKKDGFSVMEDLNKMGIKTPIIISSNLGQEEDINKAKKMGAVGYFIKSDTPISEVVNHVRRALGE